LPGVHDIPSKTPLRGEGLGEEEDGRRRAYAHPERGDEGGKAGGNYHETYNLEFRSSEGPHRVEKGRGTFLAASLTETYIWKKSIRAIMKTFAEFPRPKKEDHHREEGSLGKG